MKSILVVIPNLRGGGAERVHIDLANEWVKLGYTVSFCLTQEGGCLKDQLHESINIIELKCMRFREAFWSLKRFIKQEKADVVLAAMWPLTCLASVSWLFAGRPGKLFLVEHCAFTKQFAKHLNRSLGFIGLTKTLTYHLATCFINVSKGQEKSLKKIMWLPKNKWAVIYNGIKCCFPKYSASQINMGEHVNLDKSKKHIIAAGTFKRQKDFHTILKAFKFVLQKEPDSHLTLLGDGDMKDELEKFSCFLELQDQVTFKGFVHNIYSYFSVADVFVHSSFYEGFALVVAEALACGTQVVATDSPYGPSEILDHGKYGDLVNVGDAKMMAEKISYRLKYPIDAKILMDRAAEFSIKKSAKAYLVQFQGASVEYKH